jgi:hypothetical protein
LIERAAALAAFDTLAAGKIISDDANDQWRVARAPVGNVVPEDFAWTVSPVNLTGFHTGCLVATELSLIAPDRITQLVLIDVPAFDAQTHAPRLKNAGNLFTTDPDAETASGRRQTNSQLYRHGRES